MYLSPADKLPNHCLLHNDNILTVAKNPGHQSGLQDSTEKAPFFRLHGQRTTG